MVDINYRADIDGLRAVAVVSVLLYHLGYELFPGGFIGVDVFFVISGYLITGLIKKEYDETGSFDFVNFYIRRARRLLPGFLFTLLTTLVVATIIFAPSHLRSFGASLVHAVASISNFYFWSDSDYFDLASEVKPLLHTWSLSVEEQFYVIWPLLITFLLSKKTSSLPLLALSFLFVVSLILNFVFADGDNIFVDILPGKIGELFSNGQSTIFYLTPFRVFEFIFGAVLVWTNGSALKKYNLSGLCFIVGTVFVLYPVFTYTQQTVFPSYNALMPCLGAALIIYSGNSTPLAWVLKNKVAVGLGLISYSLYLVHWPIIVFYKYWNLGFLDGFDKVLIIVASVLLAVVVYRFIETPFRTKRAQLGDKKNEAFIFSVALVLFLIMIPSSNMWANKGWVWRLGEVTSKLYSEFGDHDDFVKKYSGGSNCEYKYSKDLGPTCDTNADLDKHVWVIGDSHGRHYTQGLEKTFPKINFKFIKNNCRLNTLSYCYKIGDSIQDIHALKKEKILELVKLDNAPIIIAQAWIQRTQTYIDIANGEAIEFNDTGRSAELALEYAKFVVDELGKVRAYFQENLPGRKIIVVGDVARSGLGKGRSPLDCSLVPVKSSRNNTCEVRTIDESFTRYVFNNFLETHINKNRKEGMFFINPMAVTCEDFRCRNYTDAGYPVYVDVSHLSLWGSQFVVKKFYSRFRYGFRDYVENRNIYAKN